MISGVNVCTFICRPQQRLKSETISLHQAGGLTLIHCTHSWKHPNWGTKSSRLLLHNCCFTEDHVTNNTGVNGNLQTVKKKRTICNGNAEYNRSVSQINITLIQMTEWWCGGKIKSGAFCLNNNNISITCAADWLCGPL